MRLVASEMVVDRSEAGRRVAGIGVDAKSAQDDRPRLLLVGVLQDFLVQNLEVVGESDALQRLHLNKT